MQGSSRECPGRELEEDGATRADALEEVAREHVGGALHVEVILWRRRHGHIDMIIGL
jgi:hypothetical protein